MKMKLFNKSKKNEDILNEKVKYIVCLRCKRKVFNEAIICPFCKFGILAYINGNIDENVNSVKN